MQENCEDYFAMQDQGCCLICPNAEPGCLCFDCKCSKCFHYTSSQESFEVNEFGEPKGICDLTLKNEDESLNYAIDWYTKFFNEPVTKDYVKLKRYCKKRGIK